MAEPLNTSELGSKSYWDAAYRTELSNHATDASDEGTIWFSDTGAEEKVLSLLEDLADEGILHKCPSSDADADDGTAVPPPTSGEGTVEFYRWDLLADDPGNWLGEGFDVVLDKGTFDAISLAEGTDGQGRRAHEGYRDRVLPLVKKGGFFVITSCNWTREEVLQWFGGGEGELRLFREVKYPSFTFGGKKGQSVCTLAFRRGK
ncbi:hypothetical protein BDZ85DRAFT_288365 [Elsinoe ampelina]|uniref:Protein-lysine N-methyltransferase EFM4 n=1 Tax=Elsinoe ampelina TaxID=302913 RepID=A0A6A6GKE3_9PEZI|nr:hypothetical protein BDZ85DRAFT_288365 [Elsinoe ampelina]